MRRSTAAPAALLTILALLSVAAAPVAAGNPEAQSEAGNEHQRIVAYWTAERVADAKPRDFERGANGAFNGGAVMGRGFRDRGGQASGRDRLR